MEIHICRDGEKFGPYPRALTHFYLREGMLSADDLCWHKGLRDWQPLGEALPPPTAASLRSLRMNPMTRPIPVASRLAALSRPASVTKAPAAKVPAKEAPSSAPSKQTRGSTHWAEHVLNGIIVTLVACAVSVYLPRGTAHSLEQTWRARVAMLGHAYSPGR